MNAPLSTLNIDRGLLASIYIYIYMVQMEIAEAIANAIANIKARNFEAMFTPRNFIYMLLAYFISSLIFGWIMTAVDFSQNILLLVIGSFLFVALLMFFLAFFGVKVKPSSSGFMYHSDEETVYMALA